jgi:biopolymer transport protein ExbD
MRFLVHKRRSAPAIIIVALVDVLIVLLIFLMVTTTFKQQAALKLTLPESSQGKKSGATENPPMIVSIDDKGRLMIGQDKLAVTLEQLRGRLQQEAATNPEIKLAINADTNAPWYRIVNVMDVVKELKIKSVSAFVDTKPVKP